MVLSKEIFVKKFPEKLRTAWVRLKRPIVICLAIVGAGTLFMHSCQYIMTSKALDSNEIKSVSIYSPDKKYKAVHFTWLAGFPGSDCWDMISVVPSDVKNNVAYADRYRVFKGEHCLIRNVEWLSDNRLQISFSDHDIGSLNLKNISITDRGPVYIDYKIRTGDTTIPEFGKTLVYYAILYNRKDVVDFLLSKGGHKVNEKDRFGVTPLSDAAGLGYKDIVELLLSKRANVNATDNGGRTALHFVVSGKHKNIVELLLNHGADINARDKNGMTPLHEATRYGRKEFVQLLLAKGAEVNPKSNNGDTPFRLAKQSNHKDIAELLHQHGGHE